MVLLSYRGEIKQMSIALRNRRPVWLEDKPHSIWRRFVQYRALLLMLLPVTVYLLLNDYLPMLGVLIAFKKVDFRLGILGSPWAGLDNFRFLFATDAWLITRNTVLYSLTFMAVNLVLSVAVALALNEIRCRFLARFYQTAMILPHFLSMVVVSYLGFGFLSNEFGYINNALLKPLGIAPVNWYGEIGYWPFLLVIVNAWKGVGIGSIVYLAAIAGIDPEYYEAAVVDGASKWQQMTRITLPMIKPVIIIITLMSLGNIFRSDFGLFYQVPLDSGALYDATQTIDTYVYRALLRMNDIGMASAAGFYQSVVGFALVLLTNLSVRKISPEDALF